jgi:hypothetical protein
VCRFGYKIHTAIICCPSLHTPPPASCQSQQRVQPPLALHRLAIQATPFCPFPSRAGAAVPVCQLSGGGGGATSLIALADPPLLPLEAKGGMHPQPCSRRALLNPSPKHTLYDAAVAKAADRQRVTAVFMPVSVYVCDLRAEIIRKTKNWVANKFAEH